MPRGSETALRAMFEARQARIREMLADLDLIGGTRTVPDPMNRYGFRYAVPAKDAAARLGVSVRTIERWRARQRQESRMS